MMAQRADVERRIIDDEAAVEEIALLLETETELASWPASARAALGLALEDESVSRAESWKIVALRRHLFGAGARVTESIAGAARISEADRRRAERVRSGLPARVQYRVAAYLSSVPAATSRVEANRIPERRPD